MGIRSLSLTAVERYVSPFDPGYNAICTNQAEIDSWDKSKAKNKDARPEPKYQHAEGATVWLLGTMSSVVMSILADDVASFGEEGAMVLRSSDNDLLAARLGLRGWENYTDDDGNQIAFETESVVLRGRRFDVVTEELISGIPIPVLRQIGQQVKKSNSVDAVMAKNSDSASSPSISSENGTVPPAQ